METEASRLSLLPTIFWQIKWIPHTSVWIRPLSSGAIRRWWCPEKTGALHVCVLPKFICWNPDPQCHDIRRWTCGVQLGQEGRALMDAVSALVRRGQRTSSLSIFLACEDARRSWQCATWKRALTRTGPRWPPGIRLPAARTVRNKSLLFLRHPVYVICCNSPNWWKHRQIQESIQPWDVLNGNLSYHHSFWHCP